LDLVKQKVPSIATPVVVTNWDRFNGQSWTSTGDVMAGDLLMKLDSEPFQQKEI
jgi:phosphotransferase system IIA component